MNLEHLKKLVDEAYRHALHHDTDPASVGVVLHTTDAFDGEWVSSRGHIGGLGYDGLQCLVIMDVKTMQDVSGKLKTTRTP